MSEATETFNEDRSVEARLYGDNPVLALLLTVLFQAREDVRLGIEKGWLEVGTWRLLPAAYVADKSFVREQVAHPSPRQAQEAAMWLRGSDDARLVCDLCAMIAGRELVTPAGVLQDAVRAVGRDGRGSNQWRRLAA
jgi:hypothetical protein